MDSSEIEVGDVFTHVARPGVELVAKAIYENGMIEDQNGMLSIPRNCHLVRKADPYHSITLPSPPAGYRLAKWGEEWTTRDAMWMDVNKWVAWDVGSKLVKWHKDKPAFSIFAIPLDQPSPLDNAGEEMFVIAVEVNGDYIVDSTGDSNLARCCTLVRKADIYHGITLPEPPAGYRLAKWGEDVTKQSLWWDGDQKGRNGSWKSWDSDDLDWSQWNPVKDGWLCIFAIPLDPQSPAPSPLDNAGEEVFVVDDETQPESLQKLTVTMQDRGYTVKKVQPPLKSWQFREVPWVVPEPQTLADVPERIRCIVIGPNGLLAVKCRIRSYSHAVLENGHAYPEPGVSADTDKFVRYLDPPPQKPMSLDDVPDGRVIQCRDLFAWKTNTADGWLVLRGDGTIWGFDPSKSEFTVTNYIAEFRGPA